MKNSRFAMILVAMLAVVSWGCSGGDKGDGNSTTAAVDAHQGHIHPGDATTTVLAATILCGDCGAVKGSESCCADGERCGDCGKIKGTALCCVELPTDAAGKDICASCGHLAEAEHACDTSCESCASCDLHKGAPACCKLNQ